MKEDNTLKTVALIGTFDTKGEEYSYIKKQIEKLGLNVLTIHVGVFEPAFKPDISNQQVAEEAGTDIRSLAERKDRAHATEVLSRGMEKLVPKLYEQGRFDGVLSFGGTGGTSLVAPGMRALPIGVPKIIVSTVASGDTSPYIGTSDLILIPSIVDVAGLNKISVQIFNNAVLAMAGMLKFETEPFTSDKPLIAASMFGVTTPAINFARHYLEARGYEVLVFHATGVGGKTMESLIQSGFFQGVLDLTTTEWADELVGGVLNAGPQRLEAASKTKTSQVVSVGALDMVNFGPYETVPEKFKSRLLYKHNPTVTLMRTTEEENKRIGEKLAEKLNLAEAYTALIIPEKGVSGIDVEGEPFRGEKEDAILFQTLTDQITNPAVEMIYRPEAINDQTFAEFAAQKLITLIEEKEGKNNE